MCRITPRRSRRKLTLVKRREWPSSHQRCSVFQSVSIATGNLKPNCREYSLTFSSFEFHPQVSAGVEALGYLAPAPAAMVADLTPREMLGAVIGVYRMAGDIGLLVGPVALGYLATRYGFEAAFLSAAACSLVTLGLGLTVPETLARTKLRKIDPRESRR